MRSLMLLFFAVNLLSFGQCNIETNVQIYNSINTAFSNRYQVNVKFAKGSEISNSYNYIGFEQDALYCVIYGFEEIYNVKLFTTYKNIYTTDCSAIRSIFSNGFVKGKDQGGRIWKILKPIIDIHQNNNNLYNTRRYNPVTSSINIERINSGLTQLQGKIDNNREVVISKADIIKNKITYITYELENLNNPESLVSIRDDIRREGNYCLDNTDFGSNKSTLSTLSCLNRLIPKLDILEMKLKDYRPESSKIFNIESIEKKNFDYCSIISIRNSDGKTAVTFNYVSPYQEGWISISPDTYLYNQISNKRYKILESLGTKFSPEKRYVPYKEKVNFILYFEQIPDSTKKLNIIECPDENCFNFYGVAVR